MVRPGFPEISFKKVHILNHQTSATPLQVFIAFSSARGITLMNIAFFNLFCVYLFQNLKIKYENSK